MGKRKKKFISVADRVRLDEIDHLIYRATELVHELDEDDRELRDAIQTALEVNNDFREKNEGRFI